MDVEKIIAAIPGRSEDARHRMRANCERTIIDGPEKMRTAAQQVIEALDQQASDDESALAEQIDAMEPADRVEAAFAALPPTKTEIKVLSALRDHPRSTGQALSIACGWKGTTWRKRLDQLLAKRAAFLAAPDSGPSDTDALSSFAVFDVSEDRYAIAPAAAEAIAKLKMLPAPAKAKFPLTNSQPGG